MDNKAVIGLPTLPVYKNITAKELKLLRQIII
jgi:hypothetical protein